MRNSQDMHRAEEDQSGGGGDARLKSFASTARLKNAGRGHPIANVPYV